jgi:hypothetical protein
LVVSFDSNGGSLVVLEKKRAIGHIKNEFDSWIQRIEQFGNQIEANVECVAIIGVKLFDYCNGKTKNG